MDCFSTFFEGFLSEHKNSIRPDLFYFLLVGFTLFLTSRVFYRALKCV